MGDLARVSQHVAPELPPSSDERTFYFEFAPRDFVTGLPHAIAPPEGSLSERSSSTSWHHAMHTEAYLLGLGEIGRAIRTVRIQLVRNIDHNQGLNTYHRAVDKAWIPRQEQERIGLILVGAAGAVTDKVVDMPAQRVRSITQSERERLFVSGEIRVQSEFVVRRVVTRYLITSGIDDMRRDEIRLYKDAHHKDERSGLINSLIGRLLPIVFEPLIPTFEHAHRRGFMPPGAPLSPAELARQLVFNEPSRFALFDEVFTETRERRRAA